MPALRYCVLRSKLGLDAKQVLLICVLGCYCCSLLAACFVCHLFLQRYKPQLTHAGSEQTLEQFTVSTPAATACWRLLYLSTVQMVSCTSFIEARLTAG